MRDLRRLRVRFATNTRVITDTLIAGTGLCFIWFIFSPLSLPGVAMIYLAVLLNRSVDVYLTET